MKDLENFICNSDGQLLGTKIAISLSNIILVQYAGYQIDGTDICIVALNGSSIYVKANYLDILQFLNS